MSRCTNGDGGVQGTHAGAYGERLAGRGPWRGSQCSSAGERSWQWPTQVDEHTLGDGTEERLEVAHMGDCVAINRGLRRQHAHQSPADRPRDTSAGLVGSAGSTTHLRRSGCPRQRPAHRTTVQRMRCVHSVLHVGLLLKEVPGCAATQRTKSIWNVRSYHSYGYGYPSMRYIHSYTVQLRVSHWD